MAIEWDAYLPRHIVDQLRSVAAKDIVGGARHWQAVVLFADITGFTSMSEALARQGSAGTEELTGILDRIFGQLIDLIHAFGGDVCQFSGDALTVLFPGGRRAATVRRAIQCALDIQATLAQSGTVATSAGPFQLAMRVGMAAGPIFGTIVGDPHHQLASIVAGATLERAVEAEREAQPGAVIIAQELFAAASLPVERDDMPAFRPITALPRKAARLVHSGRVQHRDAVPDIAGTFLHPAIAQRLRAGQGEFVSEHRQVTVLFVSFAGFDYDADPSVAISLQQYFSTVMGIVEHYDGFINKVDMGDKGSKYVVLFGAPVAHEDDEARALRCALDLQRAAGDTLKIGVHVGRTYCGLTGSDARREYTVLGDTPNQAARLMQAAEPGQTLVSDTVRQRLGRVFVWQEAPPLSLRGRGEPVPVALLRGINEVGLTLAEPLPETSMVGRIAELDRAAALIAQVEQGHGQVLHLRGERGVGKSRVAAAIAHVAMSRGLSIVRGACQAFGTRASYLPWRSVWRGIFGLEGAAASEQVYQKLSEQLRVAGPLLAERMPLLGVLLNLPIPQTELTAGLDAQLRAELLRSLLLTYLRQYAATRPLLIILEDCQWIDSLSRELLLYLARNLADVPVLLVVVARLDGEPEALLEDGPHTEVLHLSELGEQDAMELAHLRLAQHFGGEVTPALVARLTERAQGNPFYLEEMVHYLRDRSSDVSDPAALADLALPDSLHGVIMSRIDRLTEGEQATLKVASVIGRHFKANWLWGSYPALGTPDTVHAHLRTLSRLDLTPLERPAPAWDFVFKHITTQEVAYESLTFAARELLHERVGQFVEQTYEDDQFVHVLAYHYGRSRNVAKQRIFFRRAADAARAAFANDTALDYYRRLLLIIDDDDRSDVLCDLGEVLQLTGVWPEAERCYRDALAVATTSAHLAAARTALGYLLSYTHSAVDALPLLQAAEADYEHLDDPIGLARTLEYLSHVSIQQGLYDQAQVYAERILAGAQRRGDTVAVADAIELQGRVWALQHDHERAERALREATSLAERVGYRRGVIHAINDLAGVYFEQGDYPGALAALQQALDVAAEIGYVHAVGTIVGNAGELYRQRGDDAVALRCYAQNLQVILELGHHAQAVMTISDIAAIYEAQDELTQAETLWRLVVAAERDLNLPHELCQDLYRLAELLARTGRAREAALLVAEALQIAREIERHDIDVLATLLDLRLGVERGDVPPDLAVEALRSLLERWVEDGEQALILDTIWRVDPAQGWAREQAAAAYRRSYAATSNVAERRRAVELSGDDLADPAPLPPLHIPELQPLATPEQLVARWIAQTQNRA